MALVWNICECFFCQRFVLGRNTDDSPAGFLAALEDRTRQRANGDFERLEKESRQKGHSIAAEVGSLRSSWLWLAATRACAGATAETSVQPPAFDVASVKVALAGEFQEDRDEIRSSPMVSPCAMSALRRA